MTDWANTYYGAGTYPTEWIEKIRSRLEGTSVLDLCCGSGRFTHLFDPKGYLGVDISSQNIELCRKNNPRYKFVCQDVTNYDTTKRYDNVFTWVALQHIEPEYFEELAKKINRWGKNIIMCESTIGTEGKHFEGQYQFTHPYYKYFDIISEEQIVDRTYLMKARSNWQP